MDEDIRIAAAVTCSIAGDPRRNLGTVEKWTLTAKKQGASLICFPELNVTGYSTKADILRKAEPIPGYCTQYLCRLAASAEMVILAGMVEAGENGRKYASHVVATPDGMAGWYRKLHISPPEKNIFTQGSRIPLFDIHGLRFGIQLCYDAHFPELTTRMALEGADVIFMPHASPRGTADDKLVSWMRHMPARAFDNSLFIVACNHVGENEMGLSFPGVAVAISPSGEVMDQILSNRDDIMVVDLTAADQKRVRGHRMRWFLPNRRPDLYFSPDS
jgi:N-carbamoylputrescine amidase